METYSYTAVAKDGKDKKGQIEAETRDDAARKLKELGLTPMAIKQQSALDKDIEIPFLTKKKVKPRDMSVFCRQFASILNAGVSVVNALEMLAEQTENKDLKKLLWMPSRVLKKVKHYQTLCDRTQVYFHLSL